MRDFVYFPIKGKDDVFLATFLVGP